MADKNFKVKTGLDLPQPLSVEQGGTGQSSLTNALNAMLPVQTSANGKYLISDGTNTSWSTVSALFVPMPSVSVNSNITLSSNNNYFINTESARSLTLPLSPSQGDQISVYDETGSADSNNIRLNSNSNKINGVVQDLDIDVAYGVALLVYTGSIYGWRIS